MFSTLSLCLALAQLSLAVSSNPELFGTRGKDGVISFKNGTPVLHLKKTVTIPVIFFFNSEMDKGQENLAPQVRRAQGVGVNIISMPFDGWLWEWDKPIAEDEAFAWTNKTLQKFLDHAPDSYFLPRIRATGPWNWPGHQEIPKTERYTCYNGEVGPPSIGSDIFWNHFLKNFRRFLRYYEQHPLSERFIGYHIGGPCDIEWFQWRFREVGPDYSRANLESFQKWLRKEYQTDEDLSRAWGRKVSFTTAEIPQFDPKRFPMRMQSRAESITTFYSLPEEQNWVDYSKYVSEITADRICETARVLKEETSGKKLSVFFYGYNLELVGSFSGHHALEKVLACPDVDALAAPISYIPMNERLAGGVAAAMGTVDSVCLHGKLWFNEDDMRTHLITQDKLPPWLSFEAFGEPATSLFETENLLSRNLGFAYVHRMGTWWMDLIAAGAFSTPTIWQSVIGLTGKKFYEKLYQETFPYTPEVAVIVDENSWHYVRSDYDIFVNCGSLLRNNLEKVAGTIGYYTLGDFLGGIVPEAKVYVFPNLFYADDRTCIGILEKLNTQQATAIWHYAPGFITERGKDPANVSRLTGFHVTIRDGITGSKGKNRLEGLIWGWSNEGVVSPRLVIDDTGDPPFETLGLFAKDNYISAARVRHGNHISVLFTDILPSRDVMRRIFRDAKVHLWTYGDSVIRTDGKTLVAHFAHDGQEEIWEPEGWDLVPASEVNMQRSARSLTIEVKRGQTVWFDINKSE